MAKVVLTQQQFDELYKLWFIYGNNGKKQTHGNHRYIQEFIEQSNDSKEFYLNGIQNMRDRNIFTEEEIQKKSITNECIQAVEAIVYGPTTGNNE